MTFAHPICGDARCMSLAFHSLVAMISIEQWRARIGTFNCKRGYSGLISSLFSSSSYYYYHPRKRRNLSREVAIPGVTSTSSFRSSDLLPAEQHLPSYPAQTQGPVHDANQHLPICIPSTERLIPSILPITTSPPSAPSSIPQSFSSSPGGVFSLQRSLLRDVLILLIAIIFQQLIISGDIETNPGPVDEVHNEVTFSTSQLSHKDGKKIYKWEGEGLKLELPANSTATVKLKKVSSVHFELPKGSSQLSPVYWVECEGELNGSVLLELQHCMEVVEERNLADLKFAVSRVDDVDDGSNCKFELREGDFVGSSGKLEIAHFSAWRVVIVAMRSAFGLLPVLQVGLYYQKVSSSVYMVDFLVVPKQDAWEKMLLKHFDTNSKYIGSKKTTAVLNDKAVSLLLHTDSGAQPLTDDHVVNGWKLKPKEDLTVYREEMFMPSSSSKLHPRHLELRWTGKGTPTQLSQKMVIGGTEGSKWLLLETPSPGTDILSSDEDHEGVDTINPAIMALQLCYSDIKIALDSHINVVVSSSFSQCLVPSATHLAIISSLSMPPGDKVNMFLNAVEEKIAADSNSVKVFADVLRDQGSYLGVIGSDLENTYGCLLKGETPERNTPASAKRISSLLREYHEYLIAYIEGAGVIPITNHLFLAEIITEYMYKCVTQNPHTQHASIIALECRLYVTFNHNPEGKLETLLNVFDQVESTGPDVASMIRQKLRIKTPTKPATEIAMKSTTKPAIESDEDHTSITADEDTHTGTSPGDSVAQNMDIVKKHIKQQGSLEVLSLKSFLIGPSRVGKTTTRKRLTGEIKCISRDHIEPSTGIDAPLTVQLHHPTEQSSVLLTDRARDWSCQGLEEQCRTLCSAIINSPAQPATSSRSTYAEPTSSQSTDSADHNTHQLQPKQEDPTKQKDMTKHKDSEDPTKQKEQTQRSQDEVTAALTKLVKAEDWKSINELFKGVEDLILLNIVDIGGQPEFHEILPLLLHGLSLNLIFLNLAHKLDSLYTVVYRDDSGSESTSIQYESEFTIREVIERALSSISLLQIDEEHKPAAILIGTHLDHTNEASVCDLEQSIQESFKNTDFMKKDVLIFSKEGEEKRYIHLLDNTSENSEDIDKLRQLIAQKVIARFSKERIPTGALLLHLILRMKFDRHPGWCSVEECVEIAENCGISREDLLKENGILDYLHNRFGTILFYRKLKLLGQRVIINANVIMGPPSELFVHAFGTKETEPETAKHIRETGEIPGDLMKRVCSSKKVSDKLPTEEIVELMESRYILYKNACSSDEETVYFLPSVLLPDHDVAKESANPVLLASLPYSPILFLPSIRNVPLGQFSATAVMLSNHWTLVDTKRFKNRIQFDFECNNEFLRVEFRSLITHLELRIVPEESTKITPCMMTQCCHELYRHLSEVSKSYPHTKNAKWWYGFYCPHALQQPGGRPHPARLRGKYIECCQKGCQSRKVPLDARHKSWFCDTTTTRQQQRCDLNRECSDQHFAKISRSIVYWREIAPFLGLTEAEEIIIRDSTPNSIPTQKIAMLRKWKQKLGTKATYECLCQAFEDCEKGNLVELVKQLAASSSSSES